MLTTGDNYVISQQTARACLKYMAKSLDLPPNAEYLSRSHTSDLHISSSSDWKNSSIQLKVLEARARQAVMTLGKLVQQGTPWKDLNMDCVAVSRAHIEVFLLRTFINTINTTIEPTLHTPLTKLQNLVPSSPDVTNTVCSPYPDEIRWGTFDLRIHRSIASTIIIRGVSFGGHRDDPKGGYTDHGCLWI